MTAIPEFEPPASAATSAPTAQIDRLHLRGRAGAGQESVVVAERALEAHAKALGPGLLNLTYADTKRFPPPDWAIESFTRAATGQGDTYTAYRGHPVVREAVAGTVAAFLGVPTDPDTELILTPGTQAALFIALAAVLEPDDRVVMLDPDYLAYERLIRFVGAEVDHVALSYADGSGCIDPGELRAAIGPRTRAIVLSNPHNPTGAVLDEASLRAVADMALEHDLVVVIDELYARLVYDERPYTHLAALPGMADRTITTLGPSKTESLSGYRLGVARAPAPLLDAMEDVLSVAALRAPAYAQWTLVHWLRDDADFLAGRIAEYQRLRDMTVERFAACPAASVEIPGGTAYAFPRLADPGVTDQQLALALMDQAGVIVNPGYQFGPRGLGSFRICFAQEESVWAAALDRIADAIEALTPAPGV